MGGNYEGGGVERTELAPAAEYKAAYNLNEDNKELHPQIAETEAAEREFTAALQGMDETARHEIDSAAGRIARAYEMQGFLYGANCCRKADTGREDAEAQFTAAHDALFDAMERTGHFAGELEEPFVDFVGAALRAGYYAGFEAARAICR